MQVENTSKDKASLNDKEEAYGYIPITTDETEIGNDDNPKKWFTIFLPTKSSDNPQEIYITLFSETHDAL